MRYIFLVIFLICGIITYAQPDFGSNKYVLSNLQSCTHNGLHPNLGGIPVPGCYVVTDSYGRQAFAKDSTILQDSMMIRTLVRMGTTHDILYSDTLDLRPVYGGGGGSGGGTVVTDGTLTGDGSSGNPLSVNESSLTITQSQISDLSHPISDAIYGVSWNGDITNAPSKNAVYDKIESLSGGHDAVTLSGPHDYITLSGQDIIRGPIDLTTDVTGLLPGTNINSITESQISDLSHTTNTNFAITDLSFTGNRSHDLNGNSLTMTNFSSVAFESSAAGFYITSSSGAADASVFLANSGDANNTFKFFRGAAGNFGIAHSSAYPFGSFQTPFVMEAGTLNNAFRIDVDGIGINTATPAQDLHVEGTARITASDGTATTVTGRDGDGDISNVTVGTGLSLSSGTLANTGVLTTAGDWTGTLDGFEGSVLNQQFANTNLTATGNRLHNFGGFNLDIGNIDSLDFTANEVIVLGLDKIRFQSVTGDFDFTTTLGNIELNANGFGASINLISPSVDISSSTITLDAPDIILEDALTLSTWDTILTRHPTTGEIQGLLVSALTITESQISDLQAYLTAEVNDLSAAVTWANVPDANITESSVTQHEAALTITESQISDLSHTGPAGSTTEIQFNKAGVFGTESIFTVTGSGTGLGVGIGIATPSTGSKIHLHTASAGGGVPIHYTNSTTGTTLLDGFYTGYGSEAYFVNYENTPILFYTNGTERLDIGASGQLQIPAYDAGAFDASPVKYLGLDASENIVSFDSPGPAGSTGEIQFNNAGVFDANALFYFDDAAIRLGIGTASPASDLHIVNASGPTVRIATSGTEYFDLASLTSVARLNHVTPTGSLIDFNPLPQDGTSDGAFRFFRATNTTGNVRLDIHPGTNSASVNTRFAGKSIDSYINAVSTTLKLGVGTSSPATTLDVFHTTGAGFTLSRDNVGVNDPVDILIGTNADGLRLISGQSYNATLNSALQFWDNGSTFAGVYIDACASCNLHLRDGSTTNLFINGSTGSIGFGTTTFGTSAAGVLGINNGTAPTTSPANMVQLWAEDVAASSELRVRDEGGTVTTLSPHNFSGIPDGKSEEMAWSFYSEKDGKYVNVDMLKLVRLVEELTGEKLVYIGKTK